MKKVVYVPLDERPCNYLYPKALADMTDMDMIVPNKNMLGNMKTPANVPQLLEWVKEETIDADYLIVSIDMLLYGGIVPSRLHSLTIEECLERLHVLKEIKDKNPNLQIYAYNLIMRVPAYNSDEEEPSYYEQYGQRIYRLGWLSDKKELNQLSEEETAEFSKIEAEIPQEILTDYFNRRKTNFAVTKNVVQLVDSNLIDYLIIPLDDNSEFGFTAREQRHLMYQVEKGNLMDCVNIYPGADEIACTLFTRVFCQEHDYTPEIAIRYSSTNGPFIIPRYEDRRLGESIKSHITSAGGVIVHDERENNVLLMVHSSAVGGQDGMAESSFAIETRNRSYFSEVNYREFVHAMKHFISKGKNVALADVAICNGADVSLMQLVKKQGLLDELIAYAAWNTNGNTMGTVVSHAIIASYYRQDKVTSPSWHKENSKAFLYSRLVEDWGYQAVVRKHISYEVLPTIGLTPRYLGSQLQDVTKLVNEKLNTFIEKEMKELQYDIQLENVYMPWRRMFEVGYDTKLQEAKVKQ
ncbi:MULTISPECIES: DUF4127 family protein [Sutcliffiella]|uniref:DUF4127 family protein n=1 Tax=Sutcliffiella TaxID=2837511 RepID=UPI0022DE13C6|nr:MULTISPECIES: DUF4127 family protein [Sutcliffiella]MED4017847.1 DUF4127 family protein [Sutcliffiella cohnii]WBL16649.1 DUF4127 family protein [Sutcliffiella sp. NC1]